MQWKWESVDRDRLHGNVRMNLQKCMERTARTHQMKMKMNNAKYSVEKCEQKKDTKETQELNTFSYLFISVDGFPYRKNVWFCAIIIGFSLLPYHALDDLFKYARCSHQIATNPKKNREKECEQNENVISIFFRMTSATCFSVTHIHNHIARAITTKWTNETDMQLATNKCWSKKNPMRMNK